MKKLFVIFAALVIGAASMNAQNAKWSVEAGYLGSKVSMSDRGISASVDFNGFYAGVGYEIPIPIVSSAISTGLFWDYKCVDQAAGKIKANYLRVPVHYAYSLPAGETTRIFVSAGPSINVGTFGSTSANKDYFDDDIEYDDKVFGKNALCRVHVQIGVAAGIVFSEKFKITLGYDYGITKGMDYPISNRINALKIGVGYCF